MKLKSILSNELIAKSRYSNGADGTRLLEKYSSSVFGTFEAWKSLGSLWGYTELPSRLCELFAYTASRRCWHKLAIEILFHLHYPNLQCAALSWIRDPNVMCNLAVELSKDTRNTVSIFLSIIETWNWRLNRIVDNSEDKGRWINDEAPDFIYKMYDVVIKLGYVKLFSRWLFAKSYRDWLDVRGIPSEEKQLHYLMEAAIAYSWNESTFDTDFNDIDYLTFLATDIDKCHPFSQSNINNVLKGYVRLFENNLLPEMSLPLSENMINRLLGLSNVFWKAKQANLYNDVKLWVEKYACIFEGWRVKGKLHDYRHVQRESFIMSSLLEMCIYHVKDIVLKTQICDTITEHIFLQQNCCDDINIEYYSSVFCIARQAEMSISVCKLNAFDEKLILSHRNIECVLQALNFSGEIPLSVANKQLLKDRWATECDAWEGRMITTKQKNKFEFMIKLIDYFTQP